MRRAVLVALVTAPLALSAQAPTPPPPPPFREGTAEASFVGTTGNSSTQSVGVGVEMVVRPDPWETRFKLGVVRNQVSGVTSAQAVSGLARGQRKFLGKAAFFAQYAYLSDKFAGTSARHTADVGLAGPLFATARHTLSGDAGGGYATDKRTAGTGKSTAIASAGALYKWKISETADFTEDARYVGAVPDGADWRYTNVVSLAAKVNTTVSLKVSNTVRYVNQPVTGFLATDVQTSVALVAKF
jgi:putative salt-induced outer membrane protein YdiY